MLLEGDLEHILVSVLVPHGAERGTTTLYVACGVAPRRVATTDSGGPLLSDGEAVGRAEVREMVAMRARREVAKDFMISLKEICCFWYV